MEPLLCPCCGKDFIARPNRIRCSSCNKKWSIFVQNKPKTYEQSLEYLEPELSKQWDYTKNKVCGIPVSPKDFRITSNYKASWIFQNSYEWEDKIINRVRFKHLKL